jgi:hypothetical protein
VINNELTGCIPSEIGLLQLGECIVAYVLVADLVFLLPLHSFAESVWK